MHLKPLLAGALAALLASSAAPSGAWLEDLGDDEQRRVDLGEGLRILLIGVETYQNPRWPPLPGVGTDLELLSKAFRERFGCRLASGGDGPCALEQVKPSTGAELEQAVLRFAHGLRAEDRALVYFAGHGERRHGVSSLLGPDAGKETGGRVEIARLQQAFSRARSVLFAVDACFPEVEGELLDDASRDVFHALSYPGRIFLTASSNDQRALDDSPFRRAFVDALGVKGDANLDGYLTATEIGRYIQARQRDDAWPQTPQLRRWAGARGDFVLHLPERGAPSIVVLREDGAEDVPPDCAQGCPELVPVRFAELAPKRSRPVEPARCGERWVPSSSVGAACIGASAPERKRLGNEGLGLCSREGAFDHPCRHRSAERIFAPKDPVLLVSKYEVTFAEWDVCYRAGHCTHWANDHGWGRGRQPVIDVSFDDALTYVRFLRERTNKAYRLLGSDEWEGVARAGRSTPRYWGPELTPATGEPQASCWSCGSPWDGERPAPVGMFRPSPLGLHDLFGNVWEWTCADPGCLHPELKGGSFATAGRGLRAAVITWQPRHTRRETIGFRVARAREAAD